MSLRLLLLSFCLGLTTNTYAGEPTRLAVMLKEKMSCREVKRMLRVERLFIQCDAKRPIGRAWTAHYFGNEPVAEVVRELSLFEKVEKAELGT